MKFNINHLNFGAHMKALCQVILVNGNKCKNVPLKKRCRCWRHIDTLGPFVKKDKLKKN